MKIQLRLFFIALLFMSGTLFQEVLAQDNVGIGTTTPHTNAILDVSSTDKGLLVPRLNTLQRILMNPIVGADGLLVYDTDLDNFCYWSGTQWICLPGTGSNGPTGPTGPAGPTGFQGVAGPAGPAGPAGANGPAGPAGANGATGPTGANGPTGPAGPTGANGATGPAGANGATGPAGLIGPTGPTGPVNMISGVITSAGAITSGTGFTIANPSTGTDDITFTTPFVGGIPSITVTPLASVGGGGGGGGTTPVAASCTGCYTNQTDDWITNVTFNTINNTTGQNGSCSYGDYTNLNTTVTPGSTYNLSVSFFSDGTWTEYVSAWFDWNQNGTLEAGERFDLGFGIDATVSANITVPLTATLGPTRMRVIEDWNGYAADPCNLVASAYGETEDYTVIVGGGGGGVTLRICNISSVTNAGFQCNCGNLTGTPTDVGYHFSVVGN